MRSVLLVIGVYTRVWVFNDMVYVSP